MISSIRHPPRGRGRHFRRLVARQLDWLILYTLQRRLPASFEHSDVEITDLVGILAQTDAHLPQDADLMRGGTFPVTVETVAGRHEIRVRVDPAPWRSAPLVLYHHGFNQLLPDSLPRQMFQPIEDFPAHIVSVQALYHDSWSRPLVEGMASLSNFYQMLAGSVRTMATVQTRMADQGAGYTMAIGTSLGGIIAMLYGSEVGNARAIVPMLSAPDLAQLFLDTAERFGRAITIPRPVLREKLDFTPYYLRCDPARVFPLLATEDRFFRLDHNGPRYRRPPAVLPDHGHITGYRNITALRHHTLHALAWAERHPKGSRFS